MQIRFIPDNINNQIVNPLFDFITAQFNINLSDFIETIFITEDNYYSPTIKGIDDSVTISNNQNVVGIAKTIYDTKKQKSFIIIKKEALRSFFNPILSNKPFTQWKPDELDSLYTIIHEIGHTLDSKLRHETFDYKITRPFELKKVTDYYGQIIVGEIGANINASKYITSEFKKRGRHILIEHVNSSYFDFKRLINTTRNIFRDKDAFDLIGLFSILLLKVQEVYIHRLNNNEKIKSNLGRDVDNLIYQWIFNLEQQYPNWINYLEEYFLLNINILRLLGFTHIKSSYEDSIEKL